MRNIKFRVWTGKRFLFGQDYLIDVEQIYLNLDGSIYAKNGKTPAHSKFVIQQFTGLLDRNGKEIYEGDILNYVEEISFFPPFSSNLEVKFDSRNGGWSVPIVGSGYYEPNRVRVVGNIFENGELL